MPEESGSVERDLGRLEGQLESLKDFIGLRVEGVQESIGRIDKKIDTHLSDAKDNVAKLNGHLGTPHFDAGGGNGAKEQAAVVAWLIKNWKIVGIFLGLGAAGGGGGTYAFNGCGKEIHVHDKPAVEVGPPAPIGTP